MVYSDKDIEMDAFSFNKNEISFELKLYENNELLKNKLIYFKTNFDIDLKCDLSIYVYIICRMLKFYRKIIIHFPVSEYYRQQILKISPNEELHQFIFADKECIDSKNIILNRESCVLCFTGGFDSLSVMKLLSKNELYLSYTYHDGLWSDNEYKINSLFNTMYIHSNLQNSLGVGNLVFQGAPCLFYSLAIKSKYITTGDIMEYDDGYNMTREFKCMYYDMFQQLYFSHGLSEVATAYALSCLSPELLKISLNSLAIPNSEKFLRKALLLNSLHENGNLYYSIDINKNIYGKANFYNFAEGFITLYFMKFFGKEYANLYCKNIPQEAYNFVQNRSMNFYHRVNSEIFETMPKIFKKNYINQLSDIGIFPFSENDFREMHDTAKFLLKIKNNKIQ